MATGINLANAYVNVIPSFRGVQSRIQNGLAGGAGAAGDRAASTFSSRLKRGLGRAAKVGAAASGVAIGAALVGGFRSAVSQQAAEKVLGGLYGSASKATDAMKSLREVARNSPIDYSAYTSAAQSLAYAGVEGDRTTTILDNVGKAVVATGGTGQEMDSISQALLKGVNAGKFQMDTLNQISDSGVPIYDALATHFGKTTGEIQKMASEGKIGLEDVLSVMENSTGDIWASQNKAAVEASKTFSSVFSIIKDNVSTAIGQKMIPLLEKLTPIISTVGTAMVSWIEGLNFSSWDGFVASLSGGGVGDAFASIQSSLTKMSPAFQSFIGGVKDAGPALGDLAGGALNILAGAISWVGENMDKIVKALPFILGGFAAWRLIVSAQTALFAAQAPLLAYSNTLRATAAILEFRAARATAANTLATGANTTATATNNAATNMGVLARGRAVATMLAQRTATVATTVATKVAAVAQYAFGAALRFAMGPIGWIITGITLLVAGLVWFFTQTKVGQAIVQTVWAAIQTAISTVATWFTTVAWPAIQTAISALGDWFSWLYTNIIQPVWNGIKTAIAAAWSFISPIFNFIVNFIKNSLIIYFRLLWTVVQIVWKSIQIAIKVAWAIIKVIFNAIVSFVRNVLGPIFQWFYNNLIKPVWNGIKWYITTSWTGIKIIFNAIKSFLQNTLG
ncbi:MAG: tape measure protein, partial [Micrococcaceae bacterium]